MQDCDKLETCGIKVVPVTVFLGLRHDSRKVSLRMSGAITLPGHKVL